RPGFRETLLAIKRDPAVRAKVERAARQQLSLGTHARRLVAFYKRVIADRGMEPIRLPAWLNVAASLPVVGAAVRDLSTAVETAQNDLWQLRLSERRRDLREQNAQRKLGALERQGASLEGVVDELRRKLEAASAAVETRSTV